MNTKTSKYEIDMCNGSILDKLVSFSIPLMLSGILQLLFNAVDIIVVGQFTGNEALAAVGSTTALINVFVNLFIGISLGASVLAARFYATGQEKEMSETVHTSITLALISGIAMGIIGVIAAKGALELMDTPDNVLNLSTLYMRIYFMGMPFFMLYNYGAAILRAVGDTKRPLLFLIISGATNVLLNLLLVIQFHLGVAGVAIATVISQCISCILVLRCLYLSDGSYQLRFNKLGMKTRYVKQIFQIGIPAGIQSTIINFSNVLLQSSVNSFGSVAMAGYTAANNILGFLYVSVNSITQACMSFTSQNYGVRKFKRMDKVLLECLGLTVMVALVLGILILKIICIHTIWLSGKKPSELDIDIFMNYYRSCKIKGNKRYVNIVADHLEAIENKIALNLEDIRIRTIWYGRCLKICFFTICIIVCILIAEHSTSVWALVHHWFEFHCPV